jgi:hypothetical protein
MYGRRSQNKNKQENSFAYQVEVAMKRARELNVPLAVDAALVAEAERTGACNIGDLYVDGLVNGADLGVLLAYWGPITGTPASQATDINRDGVVNGLDLGILLAGWGACAP